MTTRDVRKYGNLRLVRGDAPPISAELSLEREVRARFAKMRGADGKVPGRAFYEIAEGVQHPWRLLVRRIREARAKKVPREQVKEVVREIDRYVDRVYGQQVTGEWKPAA